MPVYDVRAYFRNLATASGWSHGWYVNEDSPEQAVSAVASCWEVMVPNFAYNTTLTHFRASDVNIVGDGLVTATNGFFQGAKANKTNLETHEAVLCTVEARNSIKIPYMFKGWHDLTMIKKGPGDFDPLEPKAREVLLNFVSQARQVNLSFRALVPRAPTGGRVIQAISYDPVEQGYIIITSASSDIQTGDSVFIGGREAKFWRTLKGPHVAIRLQDGRILIRADQSCYDPTYKGSMKIWRQTHDYWSVENIFAQKVATRKSGRPFGLPVGRSPARRCR